MSVAYGFAGRVVIVTGGSGGMGRATSLAFAAAGASVVVADVDVEGGKETVEALRQRGGVGDFVATDVSDPVAVEQLVGHAVDTYGGLHCAVNAAAIEMETVRLADLAVEDFDRVQAINLRSVFLCCKHEIPAMISSGGGSIVNIASTNSFRPQPVQPAYTASKHGVLGLTRSAALDYAALGVRINAICPGAIDTPMLRNAIARRGRDADEVAGRLSPMARFGRPDEIAQAAMWLCSDASTFTTGHALAVDGGYLAS